MPSTIQRNVLVAPFPVKTPFLKDSPTGSKEKTRQGVASSQPIATSGIARPHEVWLQSVENAVNASPQLTGNLPLTNASPGQPGTFAFDANWLYICVGQNIWRRVPLTSF